MRFFPVFLLIIFASSCKTTNSTDVMVLSTIHGAHAINPNYSYDDLFKIINKYEPDLIGIEIRPEDMNQDTAYLKNFYPQEIRMIKDSFPKITRGLDFYGKEVQGKLIPIDAFKDTLSELGQYVQMERKLGKDSIFLGKKIEVGLFDMQQMQKKMALEFSAEEFMNGNYDSITKRYYQVLDSLLYGTEYQQLTEFNRRRDIEITKNALTLIQNNPEKKILILVGANHRGRMVDSLKSRKNINLIEKLNF